MSDLPTCDCYETYPGPGTHREGCNVRNEIDRLESKVAEQHKDYKIQVDCIVKQADRIAELESALREIANSPMNECGPMCRAIAKQALRNEAADEIERLEKELKHATEMERCWKANAESLADVANEKDAEIGKLKEQLLSVGSAHLEAKETDLRIAELQSNIEVWRKASELLGRKIERRDKRIAELEGALNKSGKAIAKYSLSLGTTDRINFERFVDKALKD